MKLKFTLPALLSAFFAMAQAPAGYYNSATGTGYTLKTQLYNIIKNHNNQGYAGLYTTFALSDKDFYYENNGTLLDMYSENPAGQDAYEYQYGSSQQDDGSGGTAEGQKFNREHIVPQSYFSSELPMYADAHFIIPTDKYINGVRGNFPFSKVNSATNTFTNGSKKGSNLNSGYSAGYTGVVFEPIDEFKGDIARMILYFATRYENQLSGFYTSTDASSTQFKAIFDGTANKAFSDTFLNILITWHNQDPVSQRETDRNNAIYSRQNNRNPYIDHPEYVQAIWGGALSITSPNAISNNIIVYPNPSNTNSVNIYSPVAIATVQVININGQVINTVVNPEMLNNTYTVANLTAGFYIMNITTGSTTVSKKFIIN